MTLLRVLSPVKAPVIDGSVHPDFVGVADALRSQLRFHRGDQILSELIKNLKNPYDTIRVKDLNEALQQPIKPLVVDIRLPEMFIYLTEFNGK